MQTELARERPDLSIAFLAVNERGLERGQAEMAAEGDLPLLQDDNDVRVWESWRSAWRDVIIVDATNEAVYTFNLSSDNLEDPRNYDRLKEIMISVAEGNGVPAGVAAP